LREICFLQGFQLIILPEKQCSPPQAPCCGGHFVLRRVPQQEEKKYLLSIGRIFHKISLTGSTITVTRYRPRHPYQNINIGKATSDYCLQLYQISVKLSDYRYRFHAPNHDNYEVSGVNFTTEKLENFNWNYMDQYICTRGDLVDFQLTESMKYWRYRMYLLPKDDPAMKKIIDNNLQHCKAEWSGVFRISLFVQFDSTLRWHLYSKQPNCAKETVYWWFFEICWGSFEQDPPVE